MVSRHSSDAPEAVQSAISRAGSVIASPVPSRPNSTILWYGNAEAVEVLSLRDGSAASVAASEPPRSTLGSPAPPRPLFAISRNSSVDSLHAVLYRAESIIASPVPTRPISTISWYDNEAVEAIHPREGSVVSAAASDFASPVPSSPISALSLRSNIGHALVPAPGSPPSITEWVGEEVDFPAFSSSPTLPERNGPESYVLEEEEVVEAPILVASTPSVTYSRAQNVDSLTYGSSL